MSDPTQPRRVNERELRECLRDKFAEAIAQGKPRLARRLLESWFLWDGFGGSDLIDRLRPRTNTDGEGYRYAPPSIPSDRRHGADWWVWRNQQELDIYRQESRLRYSQNSYAQGLLKNLTNNVIGKGYSYTTKVAGPDGKPIPEDKLSEGQRAECAAVQRLIERFLRLNNWNGIVDPTSNDAIAATWERQLFRLQKIDGECFPRFHRQDNGDVLVRLVDAAQVRDGGGRLPQEGWSYGIQHQMEPYEDVMRPLQYLVFWADASAKGGVDGGKDMGVWEEVDAADILHIKGPDTPANVKRGLGLFLFDLGKALDRAARLQRNLSVGASVRAGVAWTEQWAQATQAQLTSFAAALASHQHTDAQGHIRRAERMEPGTVRRVPEGWSLGETPADNTPSFLEGVQGDLKQACAGVCAPNFWMGDTGDVNYNNAESAAAPAVRDGQTEQEYWKAAFARCIWKALLWAAECGLLNEGIENRILICVEAPAVLHRNELEKAQEDQILIQSGIKDRQTAAAERGLDWKQVSANNQEYQEQMVDLGQPLPMPGEGDSDEPPLPKPKDGEQGISESMLESALLEAGFTGIDRHGHKWVNGKQVKRGDKPSGGQKKKNPDAAKAKYIGQAVGAAEHLHADKISHSVAGWVGGITEEDAGGPGQKDKKPFDVRVKKKGGGFHDIEVKSLLKGSKTAISVHEDALLRKVDHIAANPGNQFHTVAVDERATYGGGEFRDNYSGHRLYYKRGSGRYSLSQMHPVKDEAELKRLVAMPDDQLPEAARGHLPPPPPLDELRDKAAKASESRKARDQARKARNKDLLRAQARARAAAKKGAA